MTKDENIKIGDLGVAKQLDAREDLTRTCIGTPYYLSPEIVNRKSYNHKTDIWSLGVILYELCTFKKPFDTVK